MKVRQYKGFAPYLHQKDVIEELRNAKGTNKIVVCKSSRQKGKSYLVGGLLLYYAINYANTKNYCLSPSFKQAKNIYQTIVNAIIKSGVVKAKNKTDLIITLINDSTINFKSAEQRDQLRGYTADFVCIDEAAFIPDSIFHIVLPWTDAKKAPMLIVSSPFTKNGFFYQYYNYGLNHQFNTVTIDWSDEKYKDSIEQILPASKLEEYRQVLPHNVFLTEYLGEWMDTEGSVFNGFKQCIKQNTIKPTDKLSIGIDWANGGENDDTAISAINQFGEQVYLAYFNNLTPTQQIDRIEKFLLQYKQQIVVVQTELNSLGTPLTDFLKEKPQISTLKDKFIGFNTTNQSKNSLVQNLQIAFEQKEISILDDEKQIRELGYYTAEYNPKTRNVYYNAPQGLNDDICIALMLSYDAYKNGNVVGNYNISITKHTFGKNNNHNKGISYIGQ